ncbi:MAG: hypothetical protein K8R59_01780 [Thermoanaerobaculales bacterium]|nr:hypothetical protein [Thermoanaerobaculales bacterium]
MEIAISRMGFKTWLMLGLLTAALPAMAQMQFELENNFLQKVSFATGEDRGIDQNLEDNFGWMQAQGYTHLRFFGIYPNGYHTFPSSTLDANGYPSHDGTETVLGHLVAAAAPWGITISFDGWETIAESNRDPSVLGVDIVTESEFAAVVQDVLALGVTLVTEEQFGGTYMEAIQTMTTSFGARHETTSLAWWPSDRYADEQLGSVFNFYPYDQAELDRMDSFPPSNLGNIHAIAESAAYYGVPFSIAVGSFGNLASENWKNVLLYSQVQHNPERVSIEEENYAYTINPEFVFMRDVGAEVQELAQMAFGERPIANLVVDTAWHYSEHFRPAFNASLINNPAITNSLTLLGYGVIETFGSILPEAEVYYVQVAGGLDPSVMAAPPDYVLPLLNGPKPVFLQFVAGIPDENDHAAWIPIRNYFGLPPGDTASIERALPQTTEYQGHSIHWGGVELYITPIIEFIPSAHVAQGPAQVILDGMVLGQPTALVIGNENKFLVNSTVVHLEAAFVLSDLLGGPLNQPAIADIAFTHNKAIIFAEYDDAIDVNLPWQGQTHIIWYDHEGTRILERDEDLAGRFTANLLRGEFVFLRGPSLFQKPYQTSPRAPVEFILAGP